MKRALEVEHLCGTSEGNLEGGAALLGTLQDV
jgi:hypothetical protein